MPESAQPLRIFLSYAHADIISVRKLYRYLREKGFDVWLDKENLLPGQDWRLELEKALNLSDVVIVCLSQVSVSKEGFVQKEFRFALERTLEMPEGRIFLIPVRLQECEVPTRLSRYHWVDLFEREGYNRLLRGLKLRSEQLERTSVDEPQPTSIPRSDAKLSPSISVGKDVVGGNIIVGNNNVIHMMPNPTVQGESEKRTTQNSDQENVLQKEKQYRLLEAAIEKNVYVEKSTQLFVFIRRYDSKNIISILNAIDEDANIDENSVKAKGLQIEFPVIDNQIFPAKLSLKLIANDFNPPIQKKNIIIPPDGDSEICSFIMVPQKVGKLLLNLEILKDDITLVTRTMRTTAVLSENVSNSGTFMSIPIIVVTPDSPKNFADELKKAINTSQGMHNEQAIKVERESPRIQYIIHGDYINQGEKSITGNKISIHNSTIHGSVVAAESIKNSFNLIEKADIKDNLKELLKQLVEAVDSMIRALPQKQAEEVTDDIKRLIEEATKSVPNKKWYAISIEGLTKAAQNLGAIGEPVTKLAAKVLALLISRSP